MWRNSFRPQHKWSIAQIWLERTELLCRVISSYPAGFYVVFYAKQNPYCYKSSIIAWSLSMANVAEFG